MVKRELSQNKVLFSFQQSQTTNGQTATTGFLTLLVLGRQIPGLLPTSGFIKNQTDSDSSLSSHLVRFIVYLFAGYLCYHLKGLVGMIVGLAISIAVLIVGKVVIDLSG